MASKGTAVVLVLLLLVISLINVLTPIYNFANPYLFGMPFFYWFQIILLPIGTVLYLIFSFIENNRVHDKGAEK
ncbi:MAG: DUF3311 domain-containing protein [Thermoprotei archaeon]